ncbi:interferon alpha-inducible protein 27-like protein 2B [Physella acuta]|uniref:interferon alpha-inducible protein 27-like protein 2B n=1 Tax=Physella acuta TaxID=109671 RepID=UPI0027DB5468|nr:interferon alpha-inducible protein 27-like protein 2B [Physella acuta]
MVLTEAAAAAAAMAAVGFGVPALLPIIGFTAAGIKAGSIAAGAMAFVYTHGFVGLTALSAAQSAGAVGAVGAGTLAATGAATFAAIVALF